MQQPIFYTVGENAALVHAKNRLQQWGYTLSPVANGHVTHLLLPVPSFDASGFIRGGGRLDDVLRWLPETVTIVGGNLPALPYRCIDLLQDEFYLSENAAITAQCAMALLRQNRALDGAKVLLIGWGRIAKRLAPLLRDAGAEVTVAVRRACVLAALVGDGQAAVDIGQWRPDAYCIVINTAPAALLEQAQTDAQAFLLDLASVRGIDGERVVWARGLPARYEPEASGTLIAKTVLRHVLGKEQL